MSADLVTYTKTTGLAKSGGVVRQLATRLEQARQSRNAKVARADSEYVDAVRRALAAVGEEDEATNVQEPDTATASA